MLLLQINCHIHCNPSCELHRWLQAQTHCPAMVISAVAGTSFVVSMRHCSIMTILLTLVWPDGIFY